jgi:hypothetical protein
VVEELPIAVVSLKLLIFEPMVVRSAQAPELVLLYILKPVSFLELSFHARETVPDVAEDAVKFVGAGGVPAGPVFDDAQEA